MKDDGDNKVEHVIIRNVHADNGKKFCECVRSKDNLVLVTKQGEISLLGLLEQVMKIDAAFKNDLICNC